jgi:hypothetical protein
MAAAAANISGIILVTCDGKSSKYIIEQSKSLSGVTNAYRVEKEAPDSPDVIINIDAKTREDILAAKETVLNMDGVRKVKYRIV